MTQEALRLAYLYPKYLNIYGDQGNVLCLSQRCFWRGIELQIDHIDIAEHDKKFSDYDLFFIGGGQDKQQELVAKDLQTRANEIKEVAVNNAVILAICGGYQMLGDYYQTSSGTRVEGLGILDIYTEAPKEKNDSTEDQGLSAKNKSNAQRCIGNVVAKLSPEVLSSGNPYLMSALNLKNHKQNLAGQIEKKSQDENISLANYIVGFENHSGRTFITSDYKKRMESSREFDLNKRNEMKNLTMPLAFVEQGFGNNGVDGTEGAIYKNVFGTYMHGSLLPKNPQLADELILRALRRSNPEASLNVLEDSLEKTAHSAALTFK